MAQRHRLVCWLAAGHALWAVHAVDLRLISKLWAAGVHAVVSARWNCEKLAAANTADRPGHYASTRLRVLEEEAERTGVRDRDRAPGTSDLPGCGRGKGTGGCSAGEIVKERKVYSVRSKRRGKSVTGARGLLQMREGDGTRTGWRAQRAQRGRRLLCERRMRWPRMGRCVDRDGKKCQGASRRAAGGGIRVSPAMDVRCRVEKALSSMSGTLRSAALPSRAKHRAAWA
jgi:hypothetical protein